MRTPVAALAVAVTLTGCSTDFATGFGAAVHGMPADGAILLEYRHGALQRHAASIDPAAVPAAARRTAEEIVQPGGSTVRVMREWGRQGEGYRFISQFAGDDSERTVLVDPDGNVLERSHQIPLPQSPEAARATARRTRSGELSGVAVVQGGLGAGDLYRFTVVAAGGAQWYVVTTADGTLFDHGRIARASVAWGR